VVEIGDVYTNLDLDLTYRVTEVRKQDGDEVVTVETLQEGVETYRTVSEIVEMLEEGTVIEADVDESEFDTGKKEDFEIEVSGNSKRYLKGGGLVLAAVLLSVILLPVAGIFLKITAKFLIPVAILALVAYLLYRRMSESGTV